MVEHCESGVASDSARSVFLAWERLRLLFNAALAAVVFAFARADLTERDFLVNLARAFIGANLCFCLGPVVEGYLALLGFDRRVARWMVFIPGLLIGCMLAFATLFSWNMRGF